MIKRIEKYLNHIKTDPVYDDVKVKLSQKYFGKTGRLSISEIKDIWLEERYNIGFWTHSDTI